MDVSRPSSAVVPTLDGPILEVLARTTRPLSGRQIHRLTGTGSEAGIRKALTRLTEHGLVHAMQAGHAYLYTLNRAHLAAPIAEALAGLRASFLHRLRTELATWPLAPVHASLFGSAARADGDTRSDIDLLLIRPKELQIDDPCWHDQVSSLAEHVGAWTGNHAQIYDIDEAGLADHVHAGEAIVADWQRDAITLYGPDLDQLLRRLPTGGAR